MGEKLPVVLPKVATSTSLLGSFTCRKFTTWDRRLYFPSEGRRAEDFCKKLYYKIFCHMERRSKSTQPHNVGKSVVLLWQAVNCYKYYVVFLYFVIFVVFIGPFKIVICRFFSF